MYVCLHVKLLDVPVFAYSVRLCCLGAFSYSLQLEFDADLGRLYLTIDGEKQEECITGITGAIAVRIQCIRVSRSVFLALNHELSLGFRAVPVYPLVLHYSGLEKVTRIVPALEYT